MFLLMYFILRRVVAYRCVIVAMRCFIVSIDHYLSIYSLRSKQSINWSHLW